MSTLYPRSIDVNRTLSQSPYIPTTYAELNAPTISPSGSSKTDGINPELDKRILPLFSLISMAYMFPWTAIGALVTYFTNVYGSLYYTYVNIAFYSVGLPLALLQLKYDQNYDSSFGSLQAFKFRLLFAFLLMICVLLLMPLSEYYTFIFLVMLLSICTWSIHGTISNLAALVQYNSSTYQQIGFNLPVLLSLAMTFTIVPKDEFTMETAYIFYGIQVFFIMPALLAVYTLLGTSSPSSDFVKHRLIMKDQSYSMHTASHDDSDDEYDDHEGNNNAFVRDSDDDIVKASVHKTRDKKDRLKHEGKVYNKLHTIEEGKEREENVEILSYNDDRNKTGTTLDQEDRRGKKKQPLMEPVFKSMYQHMVYENLHNQQYQHQYHHGYQNHDQVYEKVDGNVQKGYNPPPISDIQASSHIVDTANINTNATNIVVNSDVHDNIGNPMHVVSDCNDNNTLSNSVVDTPTDGGKEIDYERIDDDVEFNRNSQYNSSNIQNNDGRNIAYETEEKIALLDRTSLDSMRVFSKSVFDENQMSPIFVDEAKQLSAAIKPHCRALAAVIFASIFQSSLLSQVESTSSIQIGSVLYYTRMFADLMGRPLSIYRPKCLTSIHIVELVSYFRLATVIVFVLYVVIPAKTLPIKDDYVIISYQFIFSMLSGYLVCLVYEDASMLFTSESKRTQGVRILNLAFQCACFVAVLCAAAFTFRDT